MKVGEMGMKEAIIQYEDTPSGGHLAISWKPLVRCKDCKHCKVINGNDAFCEFVDDGFAHERNWFCADGERKDT